MSTPAARPARPQRERDRYRRASLAEQAGDALAGLRRQPGVLAVLAVVLGGWLVMVLTRPTVLAADALATGDCLYIHAADADTESATGRPAGSTSAQLAALYAAGAERAPCDASHSHEVVLAQRLDDPAATAYPGTQALFDRVDAACRAAFAAYVGRPAETSGYELLVATPDEAAWSRGVRAAPCLVASRDGSWLLRPVRGSGG